MYSIYMLNVPVFVLQMLNLRNLQKFIGDNLMPKKSTNKPKIEEPEILDESSLSEPLPPSEPLPQISEIPKIEPVKPFATQEDIYNLETRIIRKFDESQEEFNQRVESLLHPESKPFYKSAYTYIGILIIIILIYILYLFIMSEKGKEVYIPIDMQGIINWIKGL